jgi:hypothetical protein
MHFPSDQLALPVIERRAEIPAGAVFAHAGRSLIVRRVCGTDAAAPVIAEELSAVGKALAGQLALWSANSVLRCMAVRT